MKKLRADKYGFTLLEVILSMAILTLISVPLMKYFSDSLRHAALMEQKQKATLLAQETIESMKSQEKLIRQVLEEDESHGYWIPSLAGTNHTYTPAAGENIFRQVAIPVAPGEDAKFFDTTTGKGTIRLVKKDYEFGGLSYDVMIDLSTELVANQQGQAVVHGIDDRKNALIVERDQEQEALAYFMAVNATYMMGTFVGEGMEATPTPDPDATPEPTSDPDAPGGGGVHLFDTVEELREHVRREAWIEIGGVQVDMPGGGSQKYYTVKAYYKYFCTDINDSPEVEFPTGNIYESQMDGLDSVYLLFNIFDPVTDVIHVEANDTSDLVATTGKAPAIILVCQNMDALLNGGGAEGGAPAPGVTFDVEEYKPTLILNTKYSTWAGEFLSIRTNIVVDREEEGGGSGTKGAILKEDGSAYTVENMDAVSNDSVRVVSIDISVFQAGDYEADGSGIPLVQMKTTKSE